MSQANPISSFGNSFSTGFWSGGDWRWRWEGRRGWGTDMDHSWNSAVYPEFRGLQPYKEQKFRKRQYMPIAYSSLTVLKYLFILEFQPSVADIYSATWLRVLQVLDCNFSLFDSCFNQSHIVSVRTLCVLFY